MKQLDFQKDTTAWILQTWASLFISVSEDFDRTPSFEIANDYYAIAG
jgi:hypothetical protein